MKPVALLISSLIYILIIFALATLNGVVLAFVLPLMIYLGYGLILKPSSLNIDIQRRIRPERLLPGEPVEVHLQITNNGARLENLIIRDNLPDGVQLSDGETSMLAILNKGDSIELGYSITAKRGYYRFQEVNVQASDHLGVRSESIDISAEGRIFVQPNVLRIGRVNIRPRGTRTYAGFIPARKGGPGIEFFGVRQYQQGDPLRWINWRASARHQQALFINQFEQERVADVGIILDTRRRSEVLINNGDSLFDCSVQAAASLADSFLADGNRVGLLLYGTQLDWTYPAYGKVQRERILQSLSRATPGESMVFERLANLPKRLFPPNAQLVLISPLHSDDLGVLVQLLARGYALMVISPDPIGFEMASLDSNDDRIALSIRLALLERVLMLQKLRQAGIQVLDWDVNTPLEAAIHVALSRPLPQIHYPDVVR